MTGMFWLAKLKGHRSGVGGI